MTAVDYVVQFERITASELVNNGLVVGAVLMAIAFGTGLVVGRRIERTDRALDRAEEALDAAEQPRPLFGVGEFRTRHGGWMPNRTSHQRWSQRAHLWWAGRRHRHLYADQETAAVGAAEGEQ